MKKIRLFLKGSTAEKDFLTEQKNNGYVLSHVRNGVYTFNEDNDIKNTILQIEFLTADMNLNDLIESNTVKKLVEKHLLFSEYKIIYSYLSIQNEYSHILNGTSDIEADYLKKIKSRLFIYNLAVTLLSILLWFLITLYDKNSFLAALPICFMFFIWITLFAYDLRMNKRIESLSLEESSYSPEITIVIHNTNEKPAIADLSYLGKWRYVSSKKHSHYYRLSTNFSEEQLKNEISSYLDVSQANIQVIPNIGIYPMGWH